jgi:hypothetical protein
VAEAEEDRPGGMYTHVCIAVPLSPCGKGYYITSFAAGCEVGRLEKDVESCCERGIEGAQHGTGGSEGRRRFVLLLETATPGACYERELCRKTRRAEGLRGEKKSVMG